VLLQWRARVNSRTSRIRAPDAYTVLGERAQVIEQTRKLIDRIVVFCPLGDVFRTRRAEDRRWRTIDSAWPPLLHVRGHQTGSTGVSAAYATRRNRRACREIRAPRYVIQPVPDRAHFQVDRFDAAKRRRSTFARSL